MTFIPTCIINVFGKIFILNNKSIQTKEIGVSVCQYQNNRFSLKTNFNYNGILVLIPITNFIFFLSVRFVPASKRRNRFWRDFYRQVEDLIGRFWRDFYRQVDDLIRSNLNLYFGKRISEENTFHVAKQQLIFFIIIVSYVMFTTCHEYDSQNTYSSIILTHTIPLK